MIEDYLFAIEINYRCNAIYVAFIKPRIDDNGEPCYCLGGTYSTLGTGVSIEAFAEVEHWLHNSADDSEYHVTLVTDDGHDKIYTWHKRELFAYDLTTRMCEVISDSLSAVLAEVSIDYDYTTDDIGNIRTALLTRSNTENESSAAAREQRTEAAE